MCKYTHKILYTFKEKGELESVVRNLQYQQREEEVLNRIIKNWKSQGQSVIMTIIQFMMNNI